MGVSKYKNNFKLTLHENALMDPLKWKKQRVVFVNSMSDLFNKEVPISFIKKVFHTMNHCPQHQFQILTKRAERLEQISSQLQWTDNIWMGVSVENENYKSRIKNLLKTEAKIKFLSLEPLLGPLPRISLKGIDWVIVGGESGSKARPMDYRWVTQIRDQCIKKRYPSFISRYFLKTLILTVYCDLYG